MKPYDMSPLKKRASLTSFKGGGEPEPPREDSVPPSSFSLTSLPEEIIFDCLIRVPRFYYQNLCRVSKTLRSLIRSPEFHRLRPLLPKHKDSVYVSTSNGWLTLRATEKTATKIEYRLVPFLTNHFLYGSPTVTVGSEIFFMDGSFKHPSSELWILDTRTGEFTQGPSMNVARTYNETVVQKIDGKVYVIGRCHNEKIHVKVFNPKSREWKVAESPKEKLPLRMMQRLSASVNEKVYMAEARKILVYDPRKGLGFEKVESPSDGDSSILSMFVVDDVLYAYYVLHGLMGFDAKRKVWRRVVGLEETLDVDFSNAATVEYNGMLAIFWYGWIKKEVRCALITSDWIGDVIRWTIEWYGTVAIMPDHNSFHKVLVCSD